MQMALKVDKYGDKTDEEKGKKYEKEYKSILIARTESVSR